MNARTAKKIAPATKNRITAAIAAVRQILFCMLIKAKSVITGLVMRNIKVVISRLFLFRNAYIHQSTSIHKTIWQPLCRAVFGGQLSFSQLGGYIICSTCAWYS